MAACRLVLSLIFLLALSGCGAEEENTSSCSDDADCAAGFVCDRLASTCVEAAEDADMDDGSDTDASDTVDSDVADADVAPDVADVPSTDADTELDVGQDAADTADAADVFDVPDVPPGMWPASPADYVNSAGPHATWISEYTLPSAMGGPDNGPTCCRDWGSISKDNIRSSTNRIDNAFAAFSASVGGLAPGLDIGVTLNQLAADDFMVVLDHRRFNGTQTDLAFDLVRLEAQFTAGTTESQARLGNGSFLVNPESFLPGTGEPAIYFENATLNGGMLDGGPSTYGFIWPLVADAFIPVPLMDTRISGTATVSAAGVSYQQGELTGYFRSEDIMTAVNEFVASSRCSCLGLQGDLYQLSGNEVVGDQCLEVQVAAARCTNAAEEVCVDLAAGFSGIEVCTLLPQLIAGITDLDLDGNCATDPDNCDYEGLSVGVQWIGVPAEVTGLVP